MPAVVNPTKRRIAVVTPWFGRELIGGAEKLAWELSCAFARADAQVDVLTTTCRSFHDDWGATYHRAGAVQIEDLTIRRFKVDSRDRAAFARASMTLTSLPRISLHPDGEPIDERTSRAFVTENISSKALLAYLVANAQAYDAFVFVPYLYGTTVAGVPLVADRAFVVPCLHDEAYAYLNPVRDIFAAARGVFYNSEGEAEVAASIYGPAIYAKSTVIGHAVDPIMPPRSRVSIDGFTPERSRYILALGRQGATKNTDFLIEAFTRFRATRPTSLQLVLAGAKPPSLQAADGVIALGAVTEDVKASLLTYARALAQPSTNESFSRAIYEAWYSQRPVLVHADCRATSRAVEASGGGWSAATIEEWAQVFGTIDESSDEAIDAFGQRGFAAAAENGTWDIVAQRSLAAIDARMRRSLNDIRVDQLVPLNAGRAACYAQQLVQALEAGGVASSISILETDADVRGGYSILHATSAHPQVQTDIIIVHNAAAYIPQGAVPIFAATLDILQRLSERGVVARLLPEAVSPADWSGLRLVRNRFDDGRRTILSIPPLDKSDAEFLIELLVALARRDGSIRLIVPAATASVEALATLTDETRELDLADNLVLLDDSRESRFAAFRAAHAACAFGRPLDAMRTVIDPLWFEIPVVGFDDPIINETIASSGLIVDSRDVRELAALLLLCIDDRTLRSTMLAESRRVRVRHAPDTIRASLLEAIAGVRARATDVLTTEHNIAR